MALSIRKKKPPTAMVPFTPETIFQGEPSPQTVKLDMLLQVMALIIQPMWKKYQPFLTLVGIRETPEELISAVLHQSSDMRMKSSIDYALSIMQAVADDQVSPQDFEPILFDGVNAIKIVNSTKVEEVTP